MQNVAEQITPERYAGNRRGGWLIAVVLLAAALLAGAVHLYAKGGAVTKVEPFTFLLIGLGFAAAQRRLSLTARGNTLGVLLFFAVVLCAGWFVLSKTTAHDLSWMRLLTWLAAFTLFPVLAEAWRQFEAVTIGALPLWFYNPEIPESQPFAYLENQPIRLRVLSDDGLHEEFSANAPVSMSLGLVFFYAVKEGRNREEWERYFINEDGRPAPWAFYVPGFVYGRNYLYPYETVTENGVDASAVIVAERLQKAVAAQPQKNINA